MIQKPDQAVVEEDAFRHMAFHVYYTKSYANEPDLTIRFIKAIVASAQAVQDRPAVHQWYAANGPDRLAEIEKLSERVRKRLGRPKPCGWTPNPDDVSPQEGEADDLPGESLNA